MPRLIFLVSFLSISVFAAGQSRKSMELSFYFRNDKHADYLSQFGDRSYTDPLKLWGKSHGIKLAYLFPVTSRFKLKAGAGYGRLGIDKINRTSPWSTDVPTRTINYKHPTGIMPVFHTDKYHYNHVELSAGFIYEHPLQNTVVLTAGADYHYYYTFSQRYRITYDNSVYHSHHSRTLGFGTTANFGILKKVMRNGYYIHPSIVIPVYQRLRGDKVFLEEENVRMTKWLNGIGFSIAIGKYF